MQTHGAVQLSRKGHTRAPVRIDLAFVDHRLSIVILKKRVMTDFPERIDEETDSGHTRRPVFATTHWSVVLAAGDIETTCAQQDLPISKQKSLVVRRF